MLGCHVRYNVQIKVILVFSLVDNYTKITAKCITYTIKHTMDCIYTYTFIHPCRVVSVV